MEIKTKYSIGDKVYYVLSCVNISSVKDFLNSSKKIDDLIGEGKVREINSFSAGSKTEITYNVSGSFIGLESYDESKVFMNKEKARLYIIKNLDSQLEEFINSVIKIKEN